MKLTEGGSGIPNHGGKKGYNRDSGFVEKTKGKPGKGRKKLGLRRECCARANHLTYLGKPEGEIVPARIRHQIEGKGERAEKAEGGDEGIDDFFLFARRASLLQVRTY